MFRNRANGAEPHSEFTPQFATFVEVLNWRARHQPDRVAYTFLKDGETELVDLTYQNLDHQARAIGMSLQSIGAAGERVLLLYPPGLEYVAAFYGCLYAGAVAVPAYPPRFNRNLLRLQTMIGDSEATVALTTAGLLSGVEHHFPQAPDLGALRWLATDKACNNPAVEWTHPAISSETLAFLQYTSGSTGSPKGVMLTHGNLLHNSALIQECFGTTPDSRGMVWLPPYHDMGLIGGILQPLFVGMPVTLMSHVSFLQRPLRWLQAISRSRATSSGGPNFAYDLCISKTSPEERATLDLSSWTTAFNGAEPIRPEVLERFARTFESCGFRREAFLPCYGLAEATLIVSGAKSVNPPVGRVFETQALEENRAVEMPSTGENEGGRVLVGCGRNLRDQKIAIVEPETRIQCSSGRIGEVWVSGPSVAQGYWKQPEETDRTFGAYLSDRTDGPFLRTGDLGFLQDSELFITGRLKDLIIIRGNNHYPQDLEATAEQSHWAMKSGCGAAFSVEVKGEEQLIIVHEVKREYRTINVYEVSEAIRRAIAENHGIELHSLVLLKPGSIPKTSSGKIQRHACRLNYLTANLQALGNWTQPLEQDAERAALNAAKNLEGATEQGSSPKDSSVIDNIQTWLVSCISKRLQILPGKIDVRESFAHYGLDSAAAVSISGELEQWLGRRLSPTLVYEYPTIAALALHLAADAAKTETFFADEGGALVAEEPIAIVGIGCRFPGAQNGLAFWQLLRDGVDAITEGALQRWGADIYDPDPAAPGKVNSCWGGFLDEVDQFDPHFFGISPREATRMDPQQRLLLEVAWEALEDAGLVAEQLAGTRTGVFVGISSNDYGQLQWSNHRGIDAYAGTGNALSIAANRLSYLLDFRGPSMSIDTACSSSLVAVHLACRSLWNKESTVALAGGVNLILSPGITINFTKAGVMAPDGRCKTFDARANGYVRGEGAGMVVLKPLSIALADGDPIYAMIRSTAINQDGRTNGLMAPNRHAQEAVLREAYKRAGISPGRIHYVEAHGTGTLLGDPIEAGALGTVLATDRPLGKLCAIGSVKTNIGHLEAAAGIAGLIKVALSLRHRAIPPSLHFHEPNPYIPFSELSLYVQQNLGHWPEDSDQTYAGVSSFGFGGTNAHVVLQGPARTDSAAVQPNRPTGRAELLPLSARHAGSLHSMVRAHQGFLTNGDDLNELHEVCYTAAVRRSHHDQRVAFVAHSHAELAEQLGTFLDGESCSSVFSGRKVPGKSPRPVFVFPGQGSQWFGMGRDLLRQEPVFREAMERCETAIGQHADWSLLEELAADEARWRMNEIEVVQPTLFAIQVALAAVWRSWGVEPEAVVGQSMGEVAAAHIAGALSLQDAAKVICLRSKLLKQVSGQGSMAIAELSYEQALHALVGYEDRLSIAVSSSPVSTVISGDTPALLQLMGELERRDVFCRLVNVDVASHSPQMDPLRGELLRLLAGLLPRRPSIPIYSTVTGENSDELAFDAAYWMRNLREPVLFSNSVQRLLEGGHDVFLEISPHPVLTGVVQQVLQHVGSEGCVVPSLRRGEDERAVMLGGLGALYARGYAVDWNRQYATRGRCVQLPSYPWQHERCWLEPEATDSGSEKELARSDYGNVGEHPLLGHHLKVAYPPGTHCWEVELDRAALAYLDDHRVRGAVVLPGAAFVEMALSAVTQAFGAGPRSLMGIEFNRALFLDPDRRQKLQVVISSRFGDEAAFHIYGYSFEAGPSEADWTLHATGTVRREAVDGAPPAVTLPSSEEFLKGEWEKIDPAEFYQKLTAAGLQYGPRFQMIERLQRRDGESLAKLRIPPELEQELDAYELHPAILDGCWQALAAALPAEVVATGDAGVYLPVRVDRVRVYSRHRKELWSHAHLRPVADQTTGILEGDIRLLDEAGHVVAEIVGLRSQRLDRSSEHRDVSEDLSDWLYDLQWQRLAPLKTPLDVDPSPTSPVSSWLIFIDKQGVGESLAELLATRSEKCVMVSVGEAFERIDESHFRLNPARPEHFRRLLDEAIGHEHSANCGVVHLWSLDIVVSEVVGVAALESAQAVGWPSALNLVRSLTHGGWTKPPRLWLVTRGVHAVGTAPAPAVVFQAPLWGLGRTVDFEHPEFHCSMIDLDTSVLSTEADALLSELCSGGPENQIAFRGQARYGLRLTRGESRKQETESLDASAESEQLSVPNSQVFHLSATSPYTVESLSLQPATRRAPEPGEVEIKVIAAGLNFRDILRAMGIYPGVAAENTWVGDECAGKIVALGEGIEAFQMGDEVLAVAAHSLGTYVTTRAEFVALKPASLTFEEAATVPIAYTTAYYALHHLGRLAKGERVLIHAAAGGVGLAAVQLARLAGAEIFATAGSPEKRTFLRSLGVQHVMDSRSLDFADEVLSLTNGTGMDLVLNSLAGAYLNRSLSIVGSFGRFIELGKMDVDQNSQVGLRSFQKNVSFSAVDMHRLFQERPFLARSIMGEVMQLLQDGDIRPLPLKVFPIEEARNAFRYMAQRKNIGKIVISLQDVMAPPENEKDFRPTIPGVDRDCSYLITGGLGGLGLEAAQWLFQQGARHLALLGRSDPSNNANAVLNDLRARGAEILVIKADVAQREELAAALAEIDRSQPPLRGIIHAAGTLDDGVLIQLDRERFEGVMRPKVDGAWNLHVLTLDRPLDFFVFFSSAASVLGSPAQGNYAAANAFMDALAHRRRSQGRPALSINWGPWSTVRLAARADRAGRLASLGFGSISPEQGLSILGLLLRQDSRSLAQVAVVPVNWRVWRDLNPAFEVAPFFSILADNGEGSRPKTSGRNSRESLSRAELIVLEPSERRQVLETHLRKQVARVLGLPASRLDIQQPVNHLGLDSLMAVELRNRVEADLGVVIPVMTFLKGISVVQLTTQIFDQLTTDHLSASSTAIVMAQPQNQRTEIHAIQDDEEFMPKIEELSDEEVDSLLNVMLTAEAANV